MRNKMLLMAGLLLASTGAMANFTPEFAVQGDGYGATAQDAIYQAQYNALIQCAMQGVGGRVLQTYVSSAGTSFHAHITAVCGSAYGNQPELPW
ncbi:hypothetical protein ABB30_09470 [Stenotrophomonas ginsengisoli]|uniref:Uncharacterized protein n=1 Tax=Stenotrophomonas ginsengisoli TaxID=336566 RepID=A0A0R0DEQ7_9GAMM|nr:hypothetical protein [Stenotrophomonas ginsengisoli]KRG76542.1 hypothetical protein ABB30_09470 [Stenotrophomonas ginsengisoli]